MQNPLSSLKNSFVNRPTYQRVLGYLGATYVGYAITLGLILPHSIVAFAPEKLGELLGRPVRLAEVRINPFTFDVTLSDFAIQEQDGSPFAGLEHLQFQLHFWQSLLQGAAVIDTIQLQGPYAHMSRRTQDNKVQFNFDDILLSLTANAAAEPASPATENTEPLRLVLGKVSIDNGRLRYDDHITEASLDYPDINIHISNIDTAHSMALQAKANEAANIAPLDHASTGQTAPATGLKAPALFNHYAIQLTDAHQANINLAGQFQLFPLKVAGDIEIAQLALAPIWQFIDEQFAVNLSQGQISAKANYQLALADNEPLQLHINRGQVNLEQLAFHHAEHPLINLPQLTIDGLATDLQQQTLTIEQIHSDGLVLHAKVNDQGLDLASLFTPKAAIQAQSAVPPETNTEAQSTAKADDPSVNNQHQALAQKDDPATAQASWSVQLGGLNIENYDINISEQLVTATSQPWRIYPLNFSTTQINSDLATPIDYNIFLGVNGNGSLSSQGKIDVPAAAIAATVQLEKLALAQFQPYLAPYINIQLKNGFLSTTGQLTANAKGHAIYQGNVELDELTVLDNVQKTPLLKWQKMKINQLDFNQQLNRLNIDHLAFHQPYAKVVIAKDRSTNISNLIVERSSPTGASNAPKAAVNANNSTAVAAQPTAKSPAAPADFSLAINKISVNQGSAYFADNSLTPNFASGIEQLEGTISQLSSAANTTASVDIKGKIDKYAPVTLKGDINPLLDMPYLDLDLVFKNVELTSVNPYSGTYAGYYIDKGQLSLALNYKLEQNQLKGSNHLVIDQLKLGKRSHSDLATSLPVSLAVALLQDRNGVIDLGVEVSGDLDSPSFSLGNIIMTALTNVITKAVTAPFSFISHLIGSDETLDNIDFAAGSASLDNQGQANLDKIAKGLTERPMLQLNLEGAVDAAHDSQAIAEQLMQTQLAKLANIPVNELPDDLSPSQFPTQGPLADALVNFYQQQFSADPKAIRATIAMEANNAELTAEDITTRWHIALYNQLVNAQNVPQSKLGDLAQERAKTVKAYLVDTQGIAPERIFLLESRVTLSQDAAQVNLSINTP